MSRHVMARREPKTLGPMLKMQQLTRTQKQKKQRPKQKKAMLRKSGIRPTVARLLFGTTWHDHEPGMPLLLLATNHPPPRPLLPCIPRTHSIFPMGLVLTAALGQTWGKMGSPKSWRCDATAGAASQRANFRSYSAALLLLAQGPFFSLFAGWAFFWRCLFSGRGVPSAVPSAPSSLRRRCN